MTIRKLLLAAAIAAPAVALAAPAEAQVGGIATASTLGAVARSKAFTSANQQITTTYKAASDQVTARLNALQAELKPLVAQIDTNHDGQLSDAEVQAAQAAKNPAIAKIQAAQEAAQRDVSRLNQPIILARAFATEQILMQYDGAFNRVVAAKKISLVLPPDAVMFESDSVDVTEAITAELDKAIPSVPITPPANWQPQQGTMQFLQQYSQAIQQAAAAQQAQGGAPAAAPRPAAPAGQPTQQTPGR